mgnify:CR=1 FL=1
MIGDKAYDSDPLDRDLAALDLALPPVHGCLGRGDTAHRGVIAGITPTPLAVLHCQTEGAHHRAYVLTSGAQIGVGLIDPLHEIRPNSRGKVIQQLPLLLRRGFGVAPYPSLGSSLG